MYLKRVIIFITIVLGFFLSSYASEEIEFVEELPEDCIWAAAPHCAFTDIIEYQGRIYCCFREATNHVSDHKKDYGKIRILFSYDGINWENFGLITDDEYDLGDPKWHITPDNKLMIHFGRRNISKSNYPWCAVKYISQEEIDSHNINKENIHEVLIDNDPDLSHYWLGKRPMNGSNVQS